MPTIPSTAFRLRWQPTWPEVPHDFTARTETGYCRIYHEDGGPQGGRWFWTAARTHDVGSGYANTPREGALLAENALLGPREQA